MNIKDNNDVDNVKYLHFRQLKNDLPGKIREIADFLEIEIDNNKFDDIVKNCTFNSMKNLKNEKMEAFFEGGMKGFINKGTNDQWANSLDDNDIEKYKQLASFYMNEDQIYWLENGEWK